MFLRRKAEKPAACGTQPASAISFPRKLGSLLFRWFHGGGGLGGRPTATHRRNGQETRHQKQCNQLLHRTILSVLECNTQLPELPKRSGSSRVINPTYVEMQRESVAISEIHIRRLRTQECLVSPSSRR